MHVQVDEAGRDRATRQRRARHAGMPRQQRRRMPGVDDQTVLDHQQRIVDALEPVAVGEAQQTGTVRDSHAPPSRLFLVGQRGSRPCTPWT